MSVDLDALPVGTCYSCCQRPATDRMVLCEPCCEKIKAEPKPSFPLDPARVVRAYAFLERHLERLLDWLERAEAMLQAMPAGDPRTAKGWQAWYEVKAGHDELARMLAASYSGVYLEQPRPLLAAARRAEGG